MWFVPCTRKRSAAHPSLRDPADANAKGRWLRRPPWQALRNGYSTAIRAKYTENKRIERFYGVKLRQRGVELLQQSDNSASHRGTLKLKILQGM